MSLCQVLSRRYLFSVTTVGTAMGSEMQTGFANFTCPLLWSQNQPMTETTKKDTTCHPSSRTFQWSQCDPLHPNGGDSHSCTTEHLCRMFPPAVGLLVWSVSRLLSCSGDADRIYSSWIMYFLPSTAPNSQSHRKCRKIGYLSIPVCQRRILVWKKAHLFYSYYHTTRGRQYSCDILWLPSKIAGISLI